MSSELVPFKIYYRSGEIRMDDNMVDLRDF
jgi:hypothetical protein